MTAPGSRLHRIPGPGRPAAGVRATRWVRAGWRACCRAPTARHPRPRRWRAAARASSGPLGGVHLVEYSESAAFCTTCHTMTPQKKAYETGVAPGRLLRRVPRQPRGGGLRQRQAGRHPGAVRARHAAPTPPPSRRSRTTTCPPTTNTCEKCHPHAPARRAGPAEQAARPGVLREGRAEHPPRPRRADPPRQRRRPGPGLVALARAAGRHLHLDPTSTSRSSTASQFKDEKTGEVEQYIAEGQVRESANADADLARLTRDPGDPHDGLPRLPQPGRARLADGRPGGRLRHGRRHDQPDPALRQAQRRRTAHDEVRHRRGGARGDQQAPRLLRDEVPAGGEGPGEARSRRRPASLTRSSTRPSPRR